MLEFRVPITIQYLLAASKKTSRTWKNCKMNEQM